MFRTMLHIQQGGFLQASQSARDMVEISNHPEIRHMYVILTISYIMLQLYILL